MTLPPSLGMVEPLEEASLTANKYDATIFSVMHRLPIRFILCCCFTVRSACVTVESLGCATAKRREQPVNGFQGMHVDIYTA